MTGTAPIHCGKWLPSAAFRKSCRDPDRLLIGVANKISKITLQVK